MKYQKDVKNLTVAYIGGGSRGWAWGFMKDLAMDPDMDGTVRLYDIDMGLPRITKSSATRFPRTRKQRRAGNMWFPIP